LKHLNSDSEIKNIIPNGGLVIAWLDILFKSLKLMIDESFKPEKDNSIEKETLKLF
jgi:hypothetical protein